MSTETNLAAAANPLAKYFRVPGLHVKLPTNGMFYPADSVDFASDGTVAVFPMRAADELLLKNPDALMSGYAIEKLLESCVPAIKYPKLVSAPDMDVLLLAIRAATYGDMMEIQASCPKCQHSNTFECNLPTLIEKLAICPADTSVRLSDDLVVYVRPYNLENQTQLSLATFEETRKVQTLEIAENITTEQRTLQMNRSMEALAALSADLMSQCVTRIVTPESEVSDRHHISEFFNNVTRSWTQKIEKMLTELNSAGIDKTLHVTCQRANCDNEWDTTVEFDPSNFFDSGSSD